MSQSKELKKKFGIRRKKTLRDYVLWLETSRGTSFILENAGRGLRDIMGNHWTCTEFKANIIKSYALEVVTE